MKIGLITIWYCALIGKSLLFIVKWIGSKTLTFRVEFITLTIKLDGSHTHSEFLLNLSELTNETPNIKPTFIDIY